MAVRSLKRRKVRTALTALGIVIGVAAIVSLKTLCDFVESEVQGIELVTMFLLSIAGISLLVAGLGIMNTMLMSVIERKREIGVLKAIGASKARIIYAFMVESGLVGAIGGVGGCILGILLLSLVQFAVTTYLRTTADPIPLSPNAVILGFLFALISATIFGLYPSWKASTLRPVEALRYE